VNEFGDRENRVRPYVLDLESSNGTRLNGERIEGSRYFEVRDKDLVKFGLSEREYVFMLPPPD
jgi:smad nuclear-interacting protein 1